MSIYPAKESDNCVSQFVLQHLYSTGNTSESLDQPSDIVYLGNHTYIISDTNNHCLKLLELALVRLTTYAGKCGVHTMTETDTKEDDTLHYPKGLSYSREREMLYVVSSSLVQTVDKEKKIKIFCRSEFTLSSAFLAGDFLLISYKHGVNVIDLDTTDTVKIGAGNSSGLANGRFNIARFCNPHGLVVVSNMVAFVADSDNGVIRLIDFQLKKVTTVCNSIGVLENRRKSIAKCKLEQPWAILLVNDSLYVGNNAGIYTSTIKGVS